MGGVGPPGEFPIPRDPQVSPRVCVVPVVPVPQGEVPGDGLPRPQSGDEVVRPHPPAERYGWQWGWCSTTFPPHPLGCSITPCHHPKPQRGGELPRLPCSPYSWVPPILPVCPSPRALPARSLSTVDPTPTQRSSDVVVIASILASLGAGLAVAALGAVGYEG